MADKLVIEIRFAWWWRLYMLGVYALCLTFNREPDPDKLHYWTKRAMRTRCIGSRAKESK